MQMYSLYTRGNFYKRKSLDLSIENLPSNIIKSDKTLTYISAEVFFLRKAKIPQEVISLGITLP